MPAGSAMVCRVSGKRAGLKKIYCQALEKDLANLIYGTED